MIRRYSSTARRLASLPMLGLFAALTACGESTAPVGSATLTVLLTDAPGNVDEVWVQVLEAYIQGDAGRTTVLPFDDTRDLVELTSLAGTSTPLAEGVQLDPQNVSQFRLVIGKAAIVTEDGEIYSKDGGLPPDALPVDVDGELRCPSCGQGQSGLKINLPDGAVTIDAGSNEIVVDFDAGQSLAHSTGTGDWVMRPVINGMDTDETGSISANVILAPGVEIPQCPIGQRRSLSDLRLMAVSETVENGDGEPLRISSKGDADGNFLITWVPRDRWQLEPGETVFDGPRMEFSVTASQSVQVSPGSTTQVNYVVNGVTCNL